MTTARAPSRWHLFCRVVDNLGDAAVMWRLARQLALEHGAQVRLLIDQPAVLERMVPDAEPGTTVDGVSIRRLSDEPGPQGGPDPADGCADVVVTGFHAALPMPYRHSMTRRPPVWINLEYLSAEDWIDRFHGLPSPHADGLTEYFFYPGFTPGSGGLLRESDLIARRDAFESDEAGAARFLAQLGVRRLEGETVASLLCYPGAPLDLLAAELARSSATLHLLVSEGVDIGAGDAARLVRAGQGRMRISRIPFLPQQDYDHLLWSCDLNFVRGEDSLTRAVWSQKPFVWHIYPQAESAHQVKLEAFLRLLPEEPLAGAMRWWNRSPGADATAMIDLLARPEDAARCLGRLSRLAAAPDLAQRLIAFTTSLVARPGANPGSAGRL